MGLDRKKFFNGVRPLFGGKLSRPQVQGMDAVIDEFERRKLTDYRWLAYMLAIDFHETAATMQPVIETRQPKELTNPSVDTAIRRLESAWKRGKMPWVTKAYWRKDKNGISWLGRGLPQVTHEANYIKAEKATGIPFTKNPELMLVLKNAVPVMFDGMIDGWFTGKKLSQYFNAKTSDPYHARQIINALESAAKVEGYYKAFNSDINDALS